MMNNYELAAAIVTTKDMLSKTGTAYVEHATLAKHLEGLLAEQLKRAACAVPQRGVDECAHKNTTWRGALDLIQCTDCGKVVYS
jgi:hypothetical protein